MVTQRPNPRARQLQPYAGSSSTPIKKLPLPGVPEDDAEAVVMTGARRERCSKHQIDFYVFEDSRCRADTDCPMCTLEDKVTELEIALKAARNGLQQQQDMNEKLTLQVNYIAAMRDACSMLSESDLVWLKSQLYLWRSDRSVKLKSSEHPYGIMAMPKRGDPEVLEVTSVGGSVLAGLITEVNQALGPDETMSYLARAMYKQLQGGTR